MALFYTDSLCLTCSEIEVEKKWWLATFDCKETKVPAEWDCRLPSDVALKLPGADEPTILLSRKAEIEQAGYDRRNERPLIFCAHLKKAQEHFRARNVEVNPIQEGGGTHFFEIHDPEGNVIEICKEP